MVKSPPRANRSMTWDRAAEVLSTMHITGIHSVNGSYRFCCWLYSLTLTFSRLPPISYHHLSPVSEFSHPYLAASLISQMAWFFLGRGMVSACLPEHPMWLNIPLLFLVFWAWHIWQLWAFGSCGEPTTACPVLRLCLPWTGGPGLICTVSLNYFSGSEALNHIPASHLSPVPRDSASGR